jgi:hypothetical protein
MNFTNELWFNEREVQTQVVTGQQTEYRYRTKQLPVTPIMPTPNITPTPVITPTPIIESTPVITPTPVITQLPISTQAPIIPTPGAPGAIQDLYSSKNEFYEDEDITIYWSQAMNANEYI